VATIVLVMANSAAGTAGDLVLEGLLQAAGHTVVRRSDEEAEYGGAYDGVVVSDSCSGGTVGSKYDTAAVPGVTFENVTWRLGTYLAGLSGTQLTVYDVEGNGGLTGTVTAFTETVSVQGIDTDTLPGTPTIVARFLGDADHGVIVHWPAGSNLTSGTAPAKRAFIRFGDGAVPVMTADGTTLVEATFAWAFGSGGATVEGTGSAALSFTGAATGRRIGPISESGTLADVVAEVYSNRINSTGDESYDVPSSGEAADLAAAFGEVTAGDYVAAAALVDPYEYDVVEFSDTATGRDHVFLRERTPSTRFWGFYVWSLDPGRTDMVVEAPHPKSDLHTHTEAASLFNKNNSRAFLLSTTHRNANAATDGSGNRVSDLANYTGVNPFQSVHEVVAVADTTVVQVHGYGNSTDPDYDIIVSEGQSSPSQRTQGLAQDLRDNVVVNAAAARVAVYDGVVGTALGATGNVQGQWSRAQGDHYWVHVEQNSDVRSDTTARGQVEDVLALGIPDVGEGSAEATLAFSAAAQGVRETSGAGSAGLTHTATANGQRETFGSGGSTLGGLAAVAVGLRTVLGDPDAPLGGVTSAAVGVREVLGQPGAGSLGGVTSLAIGFRETFGSGSAFRIFTATALGSVNGQRVGVGSAVLGFSATASGAGTGPVEGTASAVLVFTSTATAEVTQPTGFGEGQAALTITATAAGQRETFGTASSAFVFYSDAPVDELVETPTPVARPKVFAATLVARVPASSGAPSLVEVDRLIFEGLSYTHELNRPGSASLGVPIRTLSDAAKERLADLAAHPSEVWIYWGSDVVWAGEIQTIGIQDQTVQLGCAGLLGYTWRMGVTTDLTYSQVDQFAIAKSLVDHWQGQAFGNYGIDTSGISASGVERDRTYLRDELHNIGQRLQELGAVIDGFDMHVDPSSRELVLSYPTRGADLTASVFFDERNIDSASVALSVGPDDLVTDGSFTGTLASDTGTNTVTYAERSNAALRATYGRSWGSENFQNVTVEETVAGHGDAYMNARDGVFFQPGVTIVPRAGADIGDFDPGDTVTYSYDAGLGRQTGSYRVAKVTVDVDASGTTRIRTEFV
jgi:hypothetical protein